MDGVAANVLGGKGDRIGRDNEIAVARLDDGRVLANLWTDDQARIVP